MEEWKEIYFKDFDGTLYDYRGLYKINREGDVFSHKTNRIMSKSPDKDGYHRATLSKQGKQKTFKLHRLVGFMFLGLPNDREKTVINHKDQNKTNNYVENLEWCTVLYNNTYEDRQARVHAKRRVTMSSQEWKSKNTGKYHHTSKSVVSINIYTNEVTYYDNMAQAAKRLGVGTSVISRATCGRINTCVECVWVKKMEYETMCETDIANLIKERKYRYERYYQKRNHQPCSSTTTENIA